MEMDSNLKLIMDEFERMKGQFVITQSWAIERLVAIGEDDFDYYYITYDGRKFSWNSCVGRLIPLKGWLRFEDYSEILRLARLNHWDQMSNFAKLENEDQKNEVLKAINQHKKEITSIKEPDKFLTEICWTLN
jgi:hypothetical protein